MPPRTALQHARIADTNLSLLRPTLNRASVPLIFTGLPGAGVQNVLGTVIGALIFPDFRFHPLNVLGLALGMAGAVWYATEAALKVRERREAGCNWSLLMGNVRSVLLASPVQRPAAESITSLHMQRQFFHSMDHDVVVELPC